MLLRSVTQHLKDQNWLAVGIDLLIVVIGVYIGTQVSNWNDERIELRRGENFAGRLRHDIRQELITYDVEGAYYSTVYGHAHRAVELIDIDDPTLDNEFVVSAYNASQFIYDEPKRTTYDELIATGNFSLLQDANLRDAALFLYSSVVRFRLSSYIVESAYRERVRRVMPHDVQQAVRSQCGDVIDSTTGFSTGIPSDCRIEFSPERIAAAAVVIRNNPHIRSDLALLLSSLGYYISDVAAVRRQVEQRMDGSYRDPALSGSVRSDQ